MHGNDSAVKARGRSFRGGTIIRTESRLYYRETIAIRVDNSVLLEALARNTAHDATS